MNEKGLVVNFLFLVQNEYPRPEGDKRTLMSIAVCTQYVLDHFEAVEEAVVELHKELLRPVSVVAPTGVEGKIHLSIPGLSGDSAICEHIDGHQYQVLGNSPKYDQLLALDKYSKQIGGTMML